MRLLLVLILAGLMHAARSFAPDATVGGGAAGTALACGYLLLSAFLMGSIFKSLRLPRLTGYLATGIVVGPNVLGLVSQPMVVQSANLQWRGDGVNCTYRRRRARSPHDEAAVAEH